MKHKYAKNQNKEGGFLNEKRDFGQSNQAT